MATAKKKSKWMHFNNKQNNREISNLVCRERQFEPCDLTRDQVFLVIRHFHIFHNTPCLPPTPQILHTSFIPVRTTVMPTRNIKERLCKVLEGKQGVLWEMCKWRIVLQKNFSPTSFPGLLNKRESP